VVRVSGCRSGGPGFDSRALQEKKVVGLEQGPLSLVSTTEELLGRKSNDSGLEIREYGRRDSSCWPRGTLYPQKVGTNFADKRQSLGRYSLLADWGHGVFFLRAQVVKFIIMEFSPASYYFAPLWSKYSPQHPVLKHSVCYSLSVRHQVSHLYRNTGKIIILCIVIFTLLDVRQEVSAPNGMVVNLTQIHSSRISVWIKFYFLPSLLYIFTLPHFQRIYYLSLCYDFVLHCGDKTSTYT
jgi:hypothetical protein